MPKNTREYQKRTCDAAVDTLDRYLYHLKLLQNRYEEELADFEVRRAQPGGEFLEAYRPNYDDQIETIQALAVFAIELQDLTRRLKKEKL